MSQSELTKVILSLTDRKTVFPHIVSALLLSYVVPVKSKVDILQNFVAFLEYMNFTLIWIPNLKLRSLFIFKYPVGV